ncbi:hypothetical protein ABIE52_004680 [Rhodococcus sp. OAS809]
MPHRDAPLTDEERTTPRRAVPNSSDRARGGRNGYLPPMRFHLVNRYRNYGELGLQDRSSSPNHHPTATAAEVVAGIKSMRRTRKWSASRITFELRTDGIVLGRRPVTKILLGLGLNRRRFIDPKGENNRKPQVISAKRSGQMVTSTSRKLGRSPTAADGAFTVAGPSRPSDRGDARRDRSSLASVTSTCIPRSTASPVWRTPKPGTTQPPQQPGRKRETQVVNRMGEAKMGDSRAPLAQRHSGLDQTPLGGAHRCLNP